MYGIFISHKSEDWVLAGRIYDYLHAAGYCPFLDIASLQQEKFDEALEQQIKAAPYFLLILTPNTFKNICKKTSSWVLREIRAALKSECQFLFVQTKDFKWPRRLPKDIDEIRYRHTYTIERHNFFDVMKRLTDTDLSPEKVAAILDWRQKNKSLARAVMSSREEIRRQVASLEMCFGEEFVSCVKAKQPFTGENRVRAIHLSCYAASLILTPQIHMVDPGEFNKGAMFDIFRELLKDEEFTLEIILTAPHSLGAQEAIASKKLGNSRMEACPDGIFLSSYCNMVRLVMTDPVFQKAVREKRFMFMLTEMAMPYSLFQIEYKEAYAQYDHIKLDLYSEGITSTSERRSMMIFRETDTDNYRFFNERYRHIRNKQRSDELITAHHAEWFEEWEAMKERWE